MNKRMTAVLILICSLTVLALVILQLTGVWENAVYAYEPLIGVMLLLQAYQNWSGSRGIARICLWCGSAVLLVSVFIIGGLFLL